MYLNFVKNTAFRFTFLFFLLFILCFWCLLESSKFLNVYSFAQDENLNLNDNPSTTTISLTNEGSESVIDNVSTTTSSSTLDLLNTEDSKNNESTSTMSEIKNVDEEILNSENEENNNEEDSSYQEDLSPENFFEGIITTLENQKNVYYIQPILKERKLDKKIKISKESEYSCSARNFQVDFSSGPSERIVELELEGKKPKNAVLEIGSLPLGIDITFLNNANYELNVSQNENIGVLQIIKQEFSQIGNFNIPIIYTDKDSGESVICQINVINL
jgi:hypothetical protein